MPRYTVIDYAGPLDGRPIAQADTLQELASETRKLADAAPLSDFDAAEDKVIADLQARHAPGTVTFGTPDLKAVSVRAALRRAAGAALLGAGAEVRPDHEVRG